jgi:flavin reductase (DIM6/NTAB) family NADH-FMN oxidoreductase RutF
MPDREPQEVPAGVAGTDIPIDVEALRGFHRQFLTGVTIITTLADDGPRGMAINAFASVCLEPPLVLACVARTAATYEPLSGSGAFAVNILAARQRDVAMTFARSGGAEKFSEVAWRPGVSGSPLLDGVAAYLEATVESRVDAYTHTIFLGRVVAAEAYGRDPLAYLGGRFYDSAGLAEAV